MTRSLRDLQRRRVDLGCRPGDVAGLAGDRDSGAARSLAAGPGFDLEVEAGDAAAVGAEAAVAGHARVELEVDGRPATVGDDEDCAVASLPDQFPGALPISPMHSRLDRHPEFYCSVSRPPAADSARHSS